jgi:hypothetical protein
MVSRSSVTFRQSGSREDREWLTCKSCNPLNAIFLRICFDVIRTLSIVSFGESAIGRKIYLGWLKVRCVHVHTSRQLKEQLAAGHNHTAA